VADFDEGLLTGDMPVIIGPSSDDRIELHDQVSGSCLRIPFDDSPGFVQKRRYILFRWRDDYLAIVVSAEMLSEEIKAILNVRDSGLFWRKFQPSLSEEFFNEGFHFVFQQFFRTAGNNEVITVAHQINLSSSAKSSRSRVFLPEPLLQSVYSSFQMSEKV
jgi:hypothetical protein